MRLRSSWDTTQLEKFWATEDEMYLRAEKRETEKK